MKKFEYKMVSQRSLQLDWMDKDEAMTLFGELGQLGWELVCTDYGSYIFKRELDSEPFAFVPNPMEQVGERPKYRPRQPR